MGRRAAGELALSEAEREELLAMAATTEGSHALALRAQIILDSAQGIASKKVAEKHRVTQQTVGKWRARFIEHRLSGLLDSTRTGAPSKIDTALVLAVMDKTVGSKPPPGFSVWSTRTMAKEAGVSQSSVSRIWRAAGFRPQQQDTLQLSGNSRYEANRQSMAGNRSYEGVSIPASTTLDDAFLVANADQGQSSVQAPRPTRSEDARTKDVAPSTAGSTARKRQPKKNLRKQSPQDPTENHLEAAEDQGPASLETRGRKAGEGRQLSHTQWQMLFLRICDNRPDCQRLNLGSPLWNVSTVTRLIQRRYGQSLARTTVSRYLERWGIIAEHPFEVGLGKRQPAFTLWAYSAYPEIEHRAKMECGDMFWFFEDDIYPQDTLHAAPSPEMVAALPMRPKLLSVIQGALRYMGNHPPGLFAHSKDLSWVEMPTPTAQQGPSSWLVLSDEAPAVRMGRFLAALVQLSELSKRKAFLFVPHENRNTVEQISHVVANNAQHLEVCFLPSCSR